MPRSSHREPQRSKKNSFPFPASPSSKSPFSVIVRFLLLVIGMLVFLVFAASFLVGEQQPGNDYIKGKRSFLRTRCFMCVKYDALWNLIAGRLNGLDYTSRLNLINYTLKQRNVASVEEWAKNVSNLIPPHPSFTSDPSPLYLCDSRRLEWRDAFQIARTRFFPNLTLMTNQRDEYLHLGSELNLLKGNYYHRPAGLFDGGGEERIYVYRHSYSDPCFIRMISLKFMPECEPTVMKTNFVKKILITSTQRSGTHLATSLLKAMGLNIHHEGLGEDGAVSWLYAVNAHDPFFHRIVQLVEIGDAYVINNPIALSIQRFEFVFHQTRHPLKVISTIYHKCFPWDRFWEWIGDLDGFDELLKLKKQPLKRAMMYYYLWNRHIELYADMRYQIERFPASTICQSAGSLCNHESAINQIPQILQNYSTSTTDFLTWKQLEKEDLALATELKVMCIEYGYDLDINH